MEKGNSIAEKLYSFFEEKFGIPNTEVLNLNENQPKMMLVDLGLKKKTEKNSWTIIYELHSGGGFVLGENWRTNGCSWSRFLVIKNNEDFDLVKITNSMISDPFCNFETLKFVFLALREFSFDL
ncbi:MAG: hypothetical protein WCO35_00505 [Candidatus Nomurabacteria bacterium]